MAQLPVISAKDLAEANTVTTARAGHQFEIQLGHLCNNRCLFCSSGELTRLKLAKPIPVEPILAAIEEAHAAGARRVTFLGGEPTLHRGFLDALRRSVELGFQEIVIFTNGVLLPQPGFLDKACALGSFEWRISIQGGNEAAHVAVTERKDSWKRIVEGIALLRTRGQRITANMCVNDHSFRSLPDYPAMVKQYGVSQLHVDIIRPSSVGAREEGYVASILTRYSDVAPFLDEMLVRFDASDPGFDVNVGNLPYCVLPRWAHRIHHGGEETVTKSCDEAGLEVGVNKYEWHASMRRHVAACQGCVFRPQCTGIFGEYLDAHGDGEFRAVTRDQLVLLDPAQRNFVLLVEPDVEPLRVAKPPDGWKVDEWVADHRARRIEARFSSTRGASVALRVTPLADAESEAPAMVTGRYGLALHASAATVTAATVDDVRGLARWIGERLAAAPHVVVEHALDAESVVEELVDGLRRAEALARGRVRLIQMVHAVQRRGRFGDFRFVGTRPRDDGPGSVVEMRGPDGGRIDLVFALGLQAGRSQVSFDYRLGTSTDEAVARPVVEDVLRALQALPIPT